MHERSRYKGMTPALQQRLERNGRLPTLPAVALKVLELCRSDEPDIEQIARAISSDPALAVTLLRMMNSPAFGLRREVTTVHQAISLLGTVSVQTLALSFAIARDLKRTELAGFRSFWKRSVIAAVAARAIARLQNGRNTEECFLASLMQDIGVVALGLISKQPFHGLDGTVGDEHAACSSAELAEFGCDHAEVGAWLAARWKLSPMFVAAIAYSHRPGDIPDALTRETKAVARVVGVAGRIADIWVRPDAELATRIARDSAAQFLNVADDAFGALLAEIDSEVPSVAQLLDVKIGGKRELEAILERAREALTELALFGVSRVEVARRTISTMEQRARVLQLEAQQDGLTKLGNRALLDSFLKRSVEEAKVGGSSLSIVMVDLDHFKSVNDGYGHPMGDTVLIAAAAVLSSGIRPRDLAGRYGGEEFMLVLPDTDAEGARIVAERMRKRIEELSFDVRSGLALKVTASFGCANLAMMDSGAGVVALVSAADQALYAAKHGGRNRVELCTGTDAVSTAMLHKRAG